MITFNALLRSEGIAPAQVKLVRHQDGRGGTQTLYQLWTANQAAFEKYQSIQSKTVFGGVSWIASFVATPTEETLFAGLYSVGAVSITPPNTIDPLTGKTVPGLNHYNLNSVKELNDYIGKLIIAWGKGYRTWCQWAHRNEKYLVEIRRTTYELPFPGFREFRINLSKLASIPASWKSSLASVGGIYLLVCPKTGKKYVGSASSSEGFLGRWMEYAKSGHGENKRMIEQPSFDYQITVLEVVSSLVGRDELLLIENLWKEKLLSREVFGLNAN